VVSKSTFSISSENRLSSTAAASRRSPPRSGPGWSRWFLFAPAPRQLQRPHSRPRRRHRNRYRRRCGYPDNCRRTSAVLATSGVSGVSRAEGGAATLREEASRRPGEGPPLGMRPEAVPEAAARADGADGKAIVWKPTTQTSFQQKVPQPEKIWK
jgi:hypothetical protein